jgi:hypothetical protein
MTTMITINKKFKKDIKKSQILVKQISARQDRIVRRLGKKLGYSEGTPEYETLWDHVFNHCDWMIKYE